MLGLAVGFGRVGLGADVFQSEFLAGLAEVVRLVAGAIVSHYPLDSDGEALIVGDGGLEEPDTEEELASIQVPTVIIAGDDDIHTLPAAQALHRILPNAQLHSPVIQRDEWERLWEGPPEALAQARAERAAPIFNEFLQQLAMGERVAES